MPRKAKYGVTFVGYSAHVIARKKWKSGRDVKYAQLDFITGDASIHAHGGWVMVSNRVDLSAFLRSLPNLASDLRKLLCQRAPQVVEESVGFPAVTGTVSTMVSLSRGQNTVCIAPDTDVDQFIRQISNRFIEIEQVLEQAEQIGSRIKRRPYFEYIDEVKKTGLCRVECHGFGLFLDGKLIFYPNYRVGFAKPKGPNIVEVHMEPKRK
jgi:hypothetical protein